MNLFPGRGKLHGRSVLQESLVDCLVEGIVCLVDEDNIGHLRDPFFDALLGKMR